MGSHLAKSNLVNKRLKISRAQHEAQIKEDEFIKELLIILFNRYKGTASFSNENFLTQTNTFLKNSRLVVSETLVASQYQLYRSDRSRSRWSYKPHIRVTIKNADVDMKDWKKNVKKLAFDCEEPDLEVQFKLYLTCYIDKRRGYKKLVNPADFFADKSYDFIIPIGDNSKTLRVAATLQAIRSCQCLGICSFISMKTSTIRFKPVETAKTLSSMPVIGWQQTFSMITEITSDVNISLDVKCEFTNDPKLNNAFKKTKIEAHRKLCYKIFEHFPSEPLPTQMSAIMELDRQQNAISKIDSCRVCAEIIKEIRNAEFSFARQHLVDSWLSKAPEITDLLSLNDSFNKRNNSNSGKPFAPKLHRKMIEIE